jgi:hypothetical protein
MPRGESQEHKITLLCLGLRPKAKDEAHIAEDAQFINLKIHINAGQNLITACETGG